MQLTGVQAQAAILCISAHPCRGMPKGRRCNEVDLLVPSPRTCWAWHRAPSTLKPKPLNPKTLNPTPLRGNLGLSASICNAAAPAGPLHRARDTLLDSCTAAQATAGTPQTMHAINQRSHLRSALDQVEMIGIRVQS